MQRSFRVLVILGLSMACGWGQLTVDQKLAEFDQLSGLFAKGYAPHDWKKQAFGIDLFDTARWRTEIRQTRNDIEFFNVMSRWAAQLNDAHVSFASPANFTARLNFTADLYDGRLLVDIVDRIRLSPSQYPIAAGYELVSIDGVPAMRILEQMMPYTVAGNPRSTRRFAAELVTIRPQSVVPNAAEVPEFSTVVFRRFDGQLETYRIPWTRTGIPMTGVGVYPDLGANEGPEESPEEVAPDVSQVVDRFLKLRLPPNRAIRGLGALTPVFAASLPPNFVQRLGRTPTEPFFSGTFEAGGYRIGYLRIPTFGPANFNEGLLNFVREISFFQENTDGLIIDVMRNGGGNGSYASALISYLMPTRYRTLGVEIRATSAWVVNFSQTLQLLRAQGAPPPLVSSYEELLNALIEANASNRGLTRPVPWDFNPGLEREPLRDARGNPVAYRKPLMVLTDELSASAADGFAAIIQDNERGPLFGFRTMGAGGTFSQAFVGPYSRSFVSYTESLMNRKAERQEPGGYPATRYVENVGVHPDIVEDYMTAQNLFENGRPFVESFVRAMVDHIAKSQR